MRERHALRRPGGPRGVGEHRGRRVRLGSGRVGVEPVEAARRAADLDDRRDRAGPVEALARVRRDERGDRLAVGQDVRELGGRELRIARHRGRADPQDAEVGDDEVHRGRGAQEDPVAGCDPAFAQEAADTRRARVELAVREGDRRRSRARARPAARPRSPRTPPPSSRRRARPAARPGPRPRRGGAATRRGSRHPRAAPAGVIEPDQAARLPARSSSSASSARADAHATRFTRAAAAASSAASSAASASAGRRGVVRQAVDEPDPQRLLGADRAHRQAEVDRPPAPDEGRQRPGGDREPVPGAGELDPRAGRRHAQVGRDRELRAAADGRAVERGDDDRRARGHAPVELVEEVADRGALVVGEAQVGAGAERDRRRRPEQHDRLLGCRERVEQRLQRPGGRARCGARGGRTAA